MSSLSKRRRTSEAGYVDADSTDDSRSRTTPGTANTPKRASYLSPTKASLARGYPSVLKSTTEAKERRESEVNRRRSLRDLVLGSHSNDATSTLDKITPSDCPTEALNEASDLPIQSPFLHQRAVTREYAIIDHFDAVSSPVIVPRLVPRPSTPKSERHALEIDLPPTPTEAGKHTAPERPRGLAGSSSPGGAGRRRVRLRGGKTTTTSPLKPKALPPVIHEVDSIESGIEDVEGLEVASGLGSEESDKNAAGSEQIDEETARLVAQREETLKTLQSRLQSLRHECNQLEKMSTTLSTTSQASNEVISLTDIQLLLDETEYLETTIPAALETHEDFIKDPAAWLNLCSPENIRTSFYTYTKRARQRDLLVHQTTLAAPTPWSLDLLNISFETMIDVSDGKVDSVRFLGSSAKSTMCKKDALSAWIHARLDDEVTRRDLSNIVTGVGRYFAETVHRANIWKWLTARYRDAAHHTLTGTTEHTFPSRDQVLRSVSIKDESQAAELLPYLLQPHIVIPLPTTDSEPSKSLMATYTITLNSSGELSVETDICGSGIPEAAMASARDLFRQLVREQDILFAFDGVWSILVNTGERRNGHTAQDNTKNNEKSVTSTVADVV